MTEKIRDEETLSVPFRGMNGAFGTPTPEEFAEMDVMQKRIAIAKEALALYCDKMLYPTPGVYSTPLRNGDVACQCCQFGGAFLAMATLQGMEFKCSIWTKYNEMEQRLSQVFDSMTLSKIESAFERKTMCHDPFMEDETWRGNSFLRPAIEFGKRIVDNDERFVAIFRNIIQNNGEFLPEGKRGEEVGCE